MKSRAYNNIMKFYGTLLNMRDVFFILTFYGIGKGHLFGSEKCERGNTARPLYQLSTLEQTLD